MHRPAFLALTATAMLLSTSVYGKHVKHGTSQKLSEAADRITGRDTPVNAIGSHKTGPAGSQRRRSLGEVSERELLGRGDTHEYIARDTGEGDEVFARDIEDAFEDLYY